MNFDELTDEQKEKARAAKTPEDILALAKEEGYELTDDELEAEFEASFAADGEAIETEAVVEAAPPVAVKIAARIARSSVFSAGALTLALPVEI